MKIKNILSICLLFLGCCSFVSAQSDFMSRLMKKHNEKTKNLICSYIQEIELDVQKSLNNLPSRLGQKWDKEQECYADLVIVEVAIRNPEKNKECLEIKDQVSAWEHIYSHNLTLMKRSTFDEWIATQDTTCTQNLLSLQKKSSEEDTLIHYSNDKPIKDTIEKVLSWDKYKDLYFTEFDNSCCCFQISLVFLKT